MLSLASNYSCKDNQFHKHLHSSLLQFFFSHDPLMFNYSDTQKSQGKEEILTDSVFEMKMECSVKASSVLSNCDDTHYVLPVWIQTKIPPRKPPNKATTYVNNCVFLPLFYTLNYDVRDFVTTTEHFTSTLHRNFVANCLPTV